MKGNQLLLAAFISLLTQNIKAEEQNVTFNEYLRYTYFDAEESVTMHQKLKRSLNLPSDMGSFEIQYQGGDSIMRNAKIAPNPKDPNDNSLKFTINEANCCGNKRGRIQLNAYKLNNLKVLSYSVDLFLPKSQELIQTYPGSMNFYTISEWWNDEGWNGEMPFRISVNMIKKSDKKGSPLIFEVRSQIKQEEKKKPWQGNIWEEVAEDYEIPFGKWITLRYDFIQGNDKTGRFKLTVTEDSVEHSIFNIHDWTYHPENPEPSGLTSVNLIKMYVSYQLINHLVYNGQPVEMYWDNLTFYNMQSSAAVH